MKIAFLLYPTINIKITEDASFWIMLELSRRGHEVFYFESKDLFSKGSSPAAYLRKANLNLKKGYLPSPLANKATPLDTLDCIFIRKEPPFDNSYLHSLQLLTLVKDRVFVLNDPDGIAMANEKLYILSFPQFIPETLVTSSVTEASSFMKRLGVRAIVKPLDDKGGAGIFALAPGDPNLPSLLEMATVKGARSVMIQRYAPVEKHGDKRILILDGEILGVFTRRPSKKDVRANLSVGGTLHKASLSAWDKRLVSAMAQDLRRRGLYFVGLDVIGENLTEINVTSPAGIADLIFLERKHTEGRVADFIESKIG